VADLCTLSLVEVSARLLGGDIAPRDLLDAVTARINALDPDLGCYRTLAPNLSAPRPPGRDDGPLHGIPGALKANICRRDWPTDCASRLLADWRAPYDAHVVEALDAAGAVLIGSTNMDEFGMGSSTEYSCDMITRNPRSADHVPGGSSGGSAAAVAAGLAWFALGSDTGGSVRQPAHCCGVVGLKPGYGRVSRYGLVAHASSLDVVGVLARNVADAAMVFDVIAGRDVRDATSWRFVSDGCADGGLKGLRIGVPRTAWNDGVSDEQAARLERTAAALAEAGAEIVEVATPPLREALAAYGVIAAAETSANLARYDGTHFGVRRDGEDHGAMARRTRTAGFGREVKLRILVGAHVLSAGRGDALLRRARAVRAAVALQFDDMFDRVDLLLWPTADGPAFRRGEKVDDPVAMRMADRWTVPVSLAGLPALTVPTGLDGDGLPLSCQIVAPRGGEDLALAVGRAVENAWDVLPTAGGAP